MNGGHVPFHPKFELYKFLIRLYVDIVRLHLAWRLNQTSSLEPLVITISPCKTTLQERGSVPTTGCKHESLGMIHQPSPLDKARSVIIIWG